MTTSIALWLALATPPLPVLKGADGLMSALRARQRSTVVHFWASWCGACLDELPRLRELEKEAAALGADVAYISLDAPQDAAAAGQLLRDRGLLESPNTWAAVLDAPDPRPVAEKFDRRWAGGLPATFFRLESGAIVAQSLGQLRVERFLGEIRAALSKPARSHP